MADEDFDCPNFSPQKWRKDICRNCYQPLKKHQKKPTVARSNSQEKTSPKVFQRLKVEQSSKIDKTIPARERTVQSKPLEGIQPGTVKKVHEIAAKQKPPSEAEEHTSETPPKGGSPVAAKKPSPVIPRKPSPVIMTKKGSIKRPLPPGVKPAPPVQEPVKSKLPVESPAEDPVKSESPPEDPVESPAEDPVKSESPAEDPVISELPVESPAEDPVKSESPAEDPVISELLVESPAEDPVKSESPAEDPVKSESPVESPAEDPVKSELPVESPAEDPVKSESPVENPVISELPVESPAEDPVKSESPVESPVQEPVIEPPVDSPVLEAAAVDDSDEVKLKPLPNDEGDSDDIQNSDKETEAGDDDITNGSQLPPPPPPLPPIAPPVPPLALPSSRSKTMAAIAEGEVKLKPVSPPKERRPEATTAHDQVMKAIVGGVALKSVPAPQEKRVGEEKIVDPISELRMRALKRKKKEAQSAEAIIEENREEILKMAKLLIQVSGTHSFIHQLRSILHQVQELLARVNIHADVLAQRLQWPRELVDDLKEVLDHMSDLDKKVVACETLCTQTLESDGSTLSRRVNPEAVEKCVSNVVRLARSLTTDESRYFQAATSFPVDSSEILTLLGRAGDAVRPLLDRLYEKALAAYAAVFDPSATKYDISFRVQNGQRLLILCCNLSDTLAMHLQVPRHPSYSDAQLKYHELIKDYQDKVKIFEKTGEWDTEEQVVLGKTPPKPAEKPGNVELVKKIIAELSKTGSLSPELKDKVTPELLTKMEAKLVSVALDTASPQVLTGCVQLQESVFSEESDRDRYILSWLVGAASKGNQKCVMHLVKECGLPINHMSSENGTTALHRTVQRGDVSMAACLIRLGANPVIKSSFNSSPADLLALKQFPPKVFAASEDKKEPLFDLSSYINNPSLSDVVLVCDDGQRYHSHRLILCAQSPVFKAMLDSDVWAESHNKEVPMPMLSSKVVGILLKYLYTGRCLFPRDDLNLGIELMAAADQFLLDPMKAQCERLLSEKIDSEIAIPLYHAAFRFSTPILLANSCHYIASNYIEIEDTGRECLLHMLDNHGN